MRKLNSNRKQGLLLHKKHINYLLCGIVGLIFLISFISNGVTVTNNSQILGSSGLNINGYDSNWTSGNGRWAFAWNSTFTVPTTQAEVQNMSSALDLAYDFLVTTWGLPDPLAATDYEPPIEVRIVENTGYNGLAMSSSKDQYFAMEFRPAYLDISDLTHEPLKVGVHEFLHICQYKAPCNAPSNWVLEGQARMTQEKPNDWLDHCDGTEAGTSYLRQLNGFLTGSHTSDFTSLSYDACLFWNYVCEQFGTHTSDPDYGYDVIQDFWDISVNPSGTDGITMFNNLMAHRGTGKTFEDVFEDFCVANYAKDFTDATVPTKWEYIDDNTGDGSAAYETVSKELDPVPTISLVTTVSDNFDAMDRWASKYYEVNVDPTVRVITVQFNQTTTNTLFYALMAVDGNDLEYYYTSEAISFQRAIVNQGYDKICVIVVSLENSVTEHANYGFLIEGANPEIWIDTPVNSPENWQARAGVHDAPEKIPAVVTIGRRQMAPVHGLTTENFKAAIGGIEAPVLAALDGWGKYFLEIKAPNQSADGLYDLQIDLVDSDGSTVIATDTNIDSVRYGANYTDNMLVIDRSNSMSVNDKIYAARSVAKMYVNSFLSDDQMGVVRYDDTSQVIHELMQLTDSNRNTAIAQIESQITPGGWTSIGGGLLNAQNQLYSKGISGYPKEIIVLSDGLENRDPTIPTILPYILANGTTVYCVKIGDDNDDDLLQDLAAETGGAYFFCFDPASGDVSNDLAEIYRSIAGNIRNLERFYLARGTVAASNIQNLLVPVQSDVDYLEIAVHYNASIDPTSISLKNNLGINVPETRTYTKGGMGHRIYQVSGAQPGTWNVTIDPADTGSALKYFVEGVCHSSVNMRVLAPPMGSIASAWGTPTIVGEPEPIVVILSDSKPIVQANITVDIIPPEFKTYGVKFQILLYDDGAHNDGLPHDGIFGNLFTATARAGSYSFVINATGNSNDYGSFSRIRTGAFQISNGREQGFLDSDLDGLPDNWERRYGFDPYSSTGEAGGMGDPDKDGLFNNGTAPNSEFYRGTNPLNSDTDGGGESDGYEVDKNRNPLNPNDDNIDEFPIVQVKPGSKLVNMIFPSGITYSKLNIYRSNTSTFGYALIYSGAYNISIKDSPLTNYQTYYYRFQGMNATGVTGLSREYKAIPKLNVIAPEGCLIINSGAKTTTSNLVSLKIYQVEADNPNGDGFQATHMRFGNTVKALMTASWLTFDDDAIWFLSGGAGVKTIYAQIRDNQTVFEISPVFTAGIYYDATTEEVIGSETTVTILLIIIDLIVITLYFKKRKPSPILI